MFGVLLCLHRVFSRVLLLTISQDHGVKILWSAHKLSTIYVCKQRACKQTHRKIAAVTRGACYNLKMLSRSYLIYLTKTFGSINKIFGRVKKPIQAKTLIDLSKRVWLTGQKFGRLIQNVLWNQPNIVKETILLDEPFYFSECTWVLVWPEFISENFLYWLVMECNNRCNQQTNFLECSGKVEGELRF